MSDKEEKNISKALYRGKLPIGGIELNCYVLDDEKNTRIISAKTVFDAFDRPRRGRRARDPVVDGIQLPSFIGGNNLKPFINQGLLDVIQKIEFYDGDTVVSGYDAIILPRLCELYVNARSVLTVQQKPLADQADILRSSFAEVGIVALIDEATGFQYDRKYDALRVLLEMFLNDKIKPWTKQFPDRFFEELDRLYGNQKMKAQQRPQYYGKFINKYVYEPLENGLIEDELQPRYIADDKKHRKHQHLTDFGTGQLRLQIGRIMGLMEVAPSMKWFKDKQNRQGQLSFLDDFEDE